MCEWLGVRMRVGIGVDGCMCVDVRGSVCACVCACVMYRRTITQTFARSFSFFRASALGETKRDHSSA